MRDALGARVNLTLAVNSGADLSMVPDRGVDFAYANDVFIHIHDVAVVKRYLIEVQRALRPSSFFKGACAFVPLGSAQASQSGLSVGSSLQR
jgi:hypothetical protein